jgi:DNA-directed RNA polymerase sigma subunit (sigma70/sigma32)
VEHCQAGADREGLKSRRKIDAVDMPTQDDRSDDAAALSALVQQARSAGHLAPGEETKLLERAAFGDRASQERLVEVHLDMVIRLAAARGEPRLSVFDLVQEGSIGLLEAVRSFAESGEADFATFAEGRINAQMDAAIAAEAAAVREAELLVTAATDYERTELVIRRLLHREPTAAELAEKLEWTIDRTLYVARVVADARRRYDEEMLAFIDPEAIDLDDDEDGRAELDG